MSSILIQQKTHQLRAQKRQRVFACFVAPGLAVFSYVFCLKLYPPLQQAVHYLFVFSFAWSAAGAYFLKRGLSSGELPEAAGLSTGLEFCRGEIKRQLSYLRRALLWSFGPILLAIGTLVLVLATRFPLFPVGIPFLTVVVVWIAAYVFIRARQQRDLERELDELSEVEKANSI